ncbi:hypothetical protein [Burkholderia cenocepacia]|uniref:hypothetical protein n=1 Tax=Burkholderia cenocepacia TaxID=95486 RepID=UPI001907285C|nr:hypothetical protein [Burkholderia cenocepacia]MBJ9920645.1 hypothetical protein [Burkholderia cenocepacia]
MIAWLSHAWTAAVSFVGDLNEGELRLLAGAVSVVTVLVSVFAITRPLRYQKNAALVEQAVRALERAYNALTVDGTQTAPVPPNRLNWLTAARNLETYKALKREIGVKVHRRIADDHEEHWRHLFYLALQGDAYHQPTYYREPVAAPPGPSAPAGSNRIRRLSSTRSRSGPTVARTRWSTRTSIESSRKPTRAPATSGSGSSWRPPRAGSPPASATCRTPTPRGPGGGGAFEPFD